MSDYSLNALWMLSECSLSTLSHQNMKIKSFRQVWTKQTNERTNEWTNERRLWLLELQSEPKMAKNSHSTSLWRWFHEFIRDDKYFKVKLKFIFSMGPFIMMHKKFGMLWSTSVSHNKFKCKTSQKKITTLRSNENLLFIVL